MQLADIPGHNQLKSALAENIRVGRVPHAQIFSGEEGSAALALALGYAKLALCSTPGNDSCGQCASCKQFAGFQHPDVHFSFPVAKTKDSSDHPVSEEFLASWREQLISNPYPLYIDWLQRIGVENKQAQLSVYESIRINSRLRLKSYSGGKKVLILWMPEKLNNTAANKLLKLIEEPEGDSMMILVTHHPDAVLGTIASRCQRTHVPPLSPAEMRAWLGLKGVTENLTPLLAVHAAGKPGLALRAMEHPEFLNEDSARFIRWTRSSFQVNISEMINWSDETATLTRERLKSYLHFSLQIFEQTITFMHRVHDEDPFVMTDSGFQFDRFAGFVHSKNIAAISEEINRAIRDVERNLNTKVVLLDLTFTLSTLLRTST